MKRIFSLILLGIAIIFLVSCSNQNSLNGEYYNQFNYLVLEIEDGKGTYYEDSELPVTKIDSQNNTFSFSASGKEYVANYELSEDGTLIFNTGNFLSSGNEQTVYKKGSKAYNENVEK